MVSNQVHQKEIVVGTRGSRLALAQTREVLKKLARTFPQHRFRIKIIKTRGDKILDAPLPKIGGKGLFVKELEKALFQREIDLAVHSLKDLPTEIPEGLKIAAVTKRLEVRDVMIFRPRWSTLRRVGTSSLRRRAQLLHWRPDLEVVDLRGNLDTRIRKLENGLVDAIVVAVAGLKRLRIKNKNFKFKILPLKTMLPAAGQGALAIEARKGDPKVLNLIRKINHHPTELTTLAERTLLAALGGGCQIPLGAYAEVKEDQLHLQAVVASVDGRRLIREKILGDKKYPEQLGKKLAKKLKGKGVDDLIQIR